MYTPYYVASLMSFILMLIISWWPSIQDLSHLSHQRFAYCWLKHVTVTQTTWTIQNTNNTETLPKTNSKSLWKMVVLRLSFPFGYRPIGANLLLVLGRENDKRFNCFQSFVRKHGDLDFFCHRCSDVGKVGRWSNSRLVVVSFICFIVKWKMAIFERYCN